MFNANNVLDLLVEALREGGEVRLREFAKTYVSENFAYVEVSEESVDAIVTDILGALNNFDKEAALAFIEGAPRRLEPVEENEDEGGDEESSDLASRVLALEAAAYKAGLTQFGNTSSLTMETRVASLEAAARSRGLL